MSARSRSRARWACVIVQLTALVLLILHGFDDLVWPPLMWGFLCLAMVAAVLLGELDVEEDEPDYLDPAPLQLHRLDLGDGWTRWELINELTGEQVGGGITETPEGQLMCNTDRAILSWYEGQR